MANVFRLPDIGEGLTEAEIVAWHADVDDEVLADQPLVTVETDKAQADLPAPVSGVLLFRGAEAGAVLAVGEILAVIGIRGERWSGREQQPPLVGTLDEDAVDLGAVTEPTVPTPEVVPEVVSASAVPEITERFVAHRPRALPLVRREAAARGIDLTAVVGTGPGGRVTRADLAAVEADPPVVADEPPPPDPETPADPKRLRLSATRRAIARNLTEAWRTIPQVTTFGTFDATRLLGVRRALAERHGRPVPLDALIVAAVVPVLAEFPEANATLDGDDLVLHDTVRMGLAVDTDAGLVVATIPDAAALRVMDLADTVTDLGERARRRALAAGELGGQTVTISNIGAVGGGHGTPIVPLGTTLILSVGRAEPTPVVRDGEVTVAPMAPLSLAYDHRVIDGAGGRRILAAITENLEEPALFLA